MAEEFTEAQYHKTLSSLGLNREQIERIRALSADRKGIRRFRLWFLLGYIILMPASVLAYALLAHALLFTRLMQQRTEGIQYLFYDSAWMGHLFPMEFVLILLPFWVFYRVLEYFPRINLLAALWGIDDMVNPRSKYRQMNMNYARKYIDDNFNAMPLEDGLRYMNKRSRAWMTRIMFWLVVIAVPLAVFDATNYTLVTPEGVTKRSYGSFSTQNRTWDNVEKVETGCYYFTGKNGNLSLMYNVDFGGGIEVNLFEAKASGDKLAQVEKVDAILRERGKPFAISKFTHGIHTGQPYVNDMCFGKLRQRYPAQSQYDQALRLLRLEGYSGPL